MKSAPKLTLTLALSGAALLLPALGHAETYLQNTIDYAKVLRVLPLAGPDVAREVCRPDPRAERYEHDDHDERYSRPDDRDARSNTGAVVGGLGGALVGSRFGNGNGKVASTIVGAIGGAMIGDRYDNRDNDRPHEYRAPPQHCETVYEPGRITGYQVSYDYQGQRGNLMLNRDPGEWLKVHRTVTLD